MRREVKSAQNVSRMCMVCGVENGSGLGARFFEVEGSQLVGEFTPREEHQGYPGRLHGGLASALLDETMGRAVGITDPNAWGVTVELNVRFKKPVPLSEPIRALARITKDSSRLFEGSGEILLADGTVAVEATGRYLKMPVERIAEGALTDEWFTDPRPLPSSIEL